ncbi:VosA protein, variant 2 [Gigaspora margarita]|uniref:VosA protein, variant 2 n=1 Tax=Gigaspora margarita TaxID=4874 RepID=A0A8H4ELN6_GIGMA|nr:VosA protein, variant 2 [Gigaspora margarita]
MSRNTNILNTYNFVSTSNGHRPFDSTQYRLIIRQQPKQARLCSLKERDRRPVDPPPIIQLKLECYGDDSQNYLQSPYYFMCANLVHPSSNSEHFAISSKYLAGTIVSSLHKLKDIDNSDGGFFVFGDISVRVEGRYRLQFSLFEIIESEVVHIQSILSDVFDVYSPKTFPGMSESTFLSRSFSDQGVRIRIRKEHRIQMKQPQPSRHSDTSEGDNINDGSDVTEISRKRSLNLPSVTSPLDIQPTDASCYSQRPSPMIDRNVDYSFHYPIPNNNHHYDSCSSSTNHIQPIQREYKYNYSSGGHYEFKREPFQDDPISTRLNSLGISHDTDGYPKRRKLSNAEKASYDYRTTLPPLIEHPNFLSHTHDQSICTDDTSDHLSKSTVLNCFTKAPMSSQLSPVYPSYRPDSQLHLPKISPTRSHTLPPSYINSQHHQLPTPRASIDAPPLSQYPRPPFDSYKDNFSSNSNENNINNITIPQFTPHFTSSPRPVHNQLPSSTQCPPFNVINVQSSIRSSSLPVLSNTSQVLKTPEQSTFTRLPPITVLTENLGIDNFQKKKDLSITSSPPPLMVNDRIIDCSNYFRFN